MKKLRVQTKKLSELLRGDNESSIFYANALSDSEIKPELWERYRDCRQESLTCELNNLEKWIERCVEVKEIDILSLQNNIYSIARKYRYFIVEFQEMFKDKISGKAKKWYDNKIVDEFNIFVEKLEEDTRKNDILPKVPFQKLDYFNNP
ncbi:MAG: hypothetical protein WAX07_03395 [Candidatus Altiarchaeia archaeon]